MVKYRSLVVAAGWVVGQGVGRGLGLSLSVGLGLGSSLSFAVDLAALASGRVAAAQADRPAQPAPRQLAEARRAIDELSYDRAQELLGEALREGKSSPETMLQIYKLAASTAVVLGKEDLAELYYRRLLCIDPKADLEAGLAPKFKRPFAAAQAYVNAHGSLRVRTRRLDAAVEVYVESDPLSMVAAVGLDSDEEVHPGTRLDPSRRAVLPLPAEGGANERHLKLILVDELGNHLQEVPVSAAGPQLTITPPLEPGGERPQPSSLRAWWIWTVPAAASLGVGIFAGLQSQQASDDLDALLSRPNPHYDEAQALRSRSRSRATLANVSFGAAGVFSVVALVMLATRRDEPRPAAALAPVVGDHGMLGLSLSGTLPGNF
jgi:tetratricopeptide (TPR) repeat protein